MPAFVRNMKSLGAVNKLVDHAGKAPSLSGDEPKSFEKYEPLWYRSRSCVLQVVYEDGLWDSAADFYSAIVLARSTLFGDRSFWKLYG